MTAIVLALLSFAELSPATVPSAAAGPTKACGEHTHAAIAFGEDSDASVRDAVAAELALACFTLIEVLGDDHVALLDAARAVPAPWLLIVEARLVKTPASSYLPYPKMTSSSLTVELSAFDVASGQRRGHAMRSISVRGEQAVRSRAAVRVIADAVRVLDAQMNEPLARAVHDRGELASECTGITYIVVLWRKPSDVSGKAAVLHTLEERCAVAIEQFDDEGTQAWQSARKLYVPLLAVQTTLQRVDPRAHRAGVGVSHHLTITVDVLDAQAEDLKVLEHMTDAGFARRSRDDADAWREVEGSLLGPVLDRALAAP